MLCISVSELPQYHMFDKNKLWEKPFKNSKQESREENCATDSCFKMNSVTGSGYCIISYRNIHVFHSSKPRCHHHVHNTTIPIQQLLFPPIRHNHQQQPRIDHIHLACQVSFGAKLPNYFHHHQHLLCHQCINK
jgi:hypothetical protein